MRFNPEIFKTYDIRGIFGQDFDGEFAFRLGATLVKYINKKMFLIAHDDRPFSIELAKKLSEGITNVGGDVQFLGLSTTPFFNFVFKKLGVNGGVMLTASHLGPQFGGFKVFGDGGAGIGLFSGLDKIKNILSENKTVEISKYGGKIVELDRKKLIADYVDFVIKKSGLNIKDGEPIKLKIKFHTTAKDELTELIRKTNIEINDQNKDISFELDDDADRVYIFDSAGNKIRSDLIMALLVKERTSFWHKPKVIYDLRFSRGVLDAISEWGVKMVRSKAGRGFMRESMARHNADIGGELSGHIYFKENNYNETQLLTILLLLKILKESYKNIDELVEPFKTWENTGEINIPLAESKQLSEIFQDVKNKYADAKIDELDGITTEYIDWWFNLRASNTEPVARIVVEAKTKNLLNEKIKEISELISSYSTGG